jgi:hypothetical protein
MKRKKRRRRCEYCGELKHDVVTSIDPYQHDVNNITVKVAWCGDCHQVACDDI